MLKVMLVEDEKILLEDLRDNFDWASAGTEIAGTARNGREALEKIKMHKPQVVITDIKMPVMDGLTLASEIKANWKEIQIIFLTGFEDFNYARTAVEVEAAGYIMKPVDFENIRQALERAKERLHTIEEAHMNRALHTAEDAFAFLDALESKHWPLDEKFFLFMAGIDRYSSLLSEETGVPFKNKLTAAQAALRDILEKCGQSFILIALEQGRFLILLSPRHELANLTIVKWNMLNNELDREHNITLSVGQYDRLITKNQVREAYYEAMKALEYRFYYGRRQIIPHSAMCSNSEGNFYEASELEENIVGGLLKNMRDEALKVLDSYFELIRSNKVQREMVIVGVYSLLTRLFEHLWKMDRDLDAVLEKKRDFLKMLQSYDNIMDIKEFVAKILNMLFDRVYVSEDTDISRKTVMLVKNYLEEHFCEPVTVEDISRKLFYNPNYLRNIFKNYTGETIHDYLTEFRMKKSLELMADRNIKIKEVAENVGYENISYFCMLFSKYFGVSPRKYRSKLYNLEI